MYLFIMLSSHPKYRAALAKRFPRFFRHMAPTSAMETSEVESVQSVVTNVSDERVA